MNFRSNCNSTEKFPYSKEQQNKINKNLSLFSRSNSYLEIL